MFFNSNIFFWGDRRVTQILVKDVPILNIVPPPVFTSYTTFGADAQNDYQQQEFYPSLYAYEGRNVAFLIENNFYTTTNYTKMLKVVKTFDEVYDWFKFYTGREPTPYRTYNNKLTIASVTATCGAGCGSCCGFTGIEVERNWWNQVYVKNLITLDNNLYDQTIFYEFGRNFWYSDPQLWLPSLPFMDGAFAIFMRFLTMEKANLQGAPFNGFVPFSTFKNTTIGLMNTYINGSYNWNNTFALDVGVPNAIGLGCSDLMASLCFDLSGRFGNLWLENIWKITSTQPVALTAQDIPDNFIRSCAQAVNLNLTNLFENYYRWPISTSVKTYMSGLPNYIVPELTP